MRFSHPDPALVSYYFSLVLLGVHYFHLPSSFVCRCSLVSLSHSSSLFSPRFPLFPLFPTYYSIFSCSGQRWTRVGISMKLEYLCFLVRYVSSNERSIEAIFPAYYYRTANCQVTRLQFRVFVESLMMRKRTETRVICKNI